MSFNSVDRDSEFLKVLLMFEQQNYLELKEQCLRKKELFQDDLFDSANVSTYYLPTTRPQVRIDKIEWLRPSQLVKDHSIDFIHSILGRNGEKSTGSSRNLRSQFSFLKGTYGASNFIASLSILYANEYNFAQVVPQGQSFEKGEYAGIFHFRLWQYGKWYDIVIDDRLPTVNGKLIQVHTRANVEFWPALLEKAFAKLNGCYQSLHQCALEDFLEDMTGGMCENISSAMPNSLNEGLFKILNQSLTKNSHVIVRILNENANKSKIEPTSSYRLLSNGLIKNQSYVVLDAKIFEPSGGDKIYLIKLSNPWKRLNQLAIGIKCNNSKDRLDGKWNGSWSEDSSEWINLLDDVKMQHDLILECDSYFWMPIESFFGTFTEVTICHTTGAHIPCSDNGWYCSSFHGCWISGVSAGGCYNEKTFSQNPAYLMPIRSPKSSTKSSKEELEKKKDVSMEATHTVILSLMQKYRNSKRIKGVQDLKIGFHLFKLETDDRKYIQELIYDDTEMSMSGKAPLEEVKVRVKMKPEFFHLKKGESPMKFFTNIRSVGGRSHLTDGNYIIVPSTFAANLDGNFMLRAFCDSPFRISSRDVIELAKSRCDSEQPIPVQKFYFCERMFSRSIENISDINENIEAEQLKLLLKSVITWNRKCFNLEQCKSLVAMYDLDCKGTLSYVQLQQLCIDLEESFQLFLRNDKTFSKSISASELKSALAELDISANSQVIEMLVNRFGTKKKIVVYGIAIRELMFDNFALCILKLRKALVYWGIRFRSSLLVNSDTKSSALALVELVRLIVYS